MKKSRMWFIRFSILIVVISVFFAMTIPASATIFKAQGYIENIETYEDFSEIDYRFLASQAQVYVFNADNNYEVVYSGIGFFHDIGFVPGVHYRISICPLGYRSRENGIDVDTIASAFNLSTGFGFVYEDGEETGWAEIVKPSAYVRFYAQDSNNAVSTQSLNLVAPNGKTIVESQNNPITVPGQADIMNFEFLWDDVYWESDPVPTGLEVKDFFMTAVVQNDLLYTHYLQWTNGTLDEIEDLLTSQQPVTPPPDSGDISFVEDMEKDIMDYLDDGFGDYGDLISGFATVVFNIGPSLTFVSWIITRISGIRFFSVIISSVTALGLTAFVLNLVISISTRNRNKGGDS